MDTTRDIAVAFTEAAHAEPAEWRDAVVKNADVWLTADELRSVTDALESVLEPYRGRRSSDRPVEGRRVRVMNVVVPHPRRSTRDAPRTA